MMKLICIIGLISIALGQYVPSPTVPPICAVIRCASPCDENFGVTCDGCAAPSVTCSVEKCDESPCCGCAVFKIGDRDVTEECQRGGMILLVNIKDYHRVCIPEFYIEIACKCPVGQTYCCDGNEYSSLCAATCNTCYDIDQDCTLGPC